MNTCNGRKTVALAIAASIVAICCALEPLFAEVLPKRGLQDVNQTCVELQGGFWGKRQDTNYKVTVPHALDCLEKAGHMTNFDKAAGKFDGPLRGNHAFDSDLHKVLEGAMYALRHHDDKPLSKRVDSIVDRILAAQQDDGYLVSCFIVEDQDKRWDNMRMQHPLYNTGHFFEMAVAHKQLTGDDKVLNAAIKFADLIDSIFGPGKIYDVDGHQEIELALIKLYRVTGDRKYLKLSKFFLDERGYVHGKEHKRFDMSTLPPYPPNVEHLPKSERHRALFIAKWMRRSGRMQDHKPLVEQDATGHAVRAGYTYATMADIVRYMDAPDYAIALDRIWKDVVSHKMYITGSVGTAQYGDEGFGDSYLLPNKTYCESCANIANVLWQHRMATLKAEAKYADVMELALYNGAISGISIAGNAFFYQNPLQSKGAKRSSWIGLACCPSNLARFIPQVGGFMYAVGKESIYVNLYAAGSASIKTENGKAVRVEQKTDYPWDGTVKLSVTPKKASEFALCLRIPGWAKGRPVPSDLYHFGGSDVKPVTLKINGESVDATAASDGYVHLNRTWKKGDSVELDLPMSIKRVYANAKVEADKGKVALMRGPIVYCLEAVDNAGVDFSKLQLPCKSVLMADHCPDLLGGVTVLKGEAVSNGKKVNVMAIPYYAWANRDKGAMTVWLDETKPVSKSDADKITGNAPIKVFILAGQSNMEGKGVVSMDHPESYNGGKGNLVWSMKNSASAEKMKQLKDENGKWVVRDDVQISYKTGNKVRKGGLTVGYTNYGGSTHIGPELQFGNAIGDYYDAPVLLIKTAWGGKSLYVDFRPPSSGGKVGPYYKQMIEEVYAALGELNYDNFEIAGFIWLQGWNDMCTKPAIPEYADNLVNLAKDIRREFNVPELPFIVGELGNGGPTKKPGSMADFRKAQRQGTARIKNALFVETTGCARPNKLSPNTGHGHHWFGNAESYFLVGGALGKATIKLIDKKD